MYMDTPTCPTCGQLTTRLSPLTEHTDNRDTQRVASLILRKLQRTNGPVLAGAIRRAVAARDRHHYPEAIRLLTQTRQVEFQPPTIYGHKGTYRLT